MATNEELLRRIEELERVALKRNDYQSRALIQEMIFIKQDAVQLQNINLGTGDGSANIIDNPDAFVAVEWKGRLWDVPFFNIP